MEGITKEKTELKGKLTITTTYPNGYVIEESLPISEIWERLQEKIEQRTMKTGWGSATSYFTQSKILGSSLTT